LSVIKMRTHLSRAGTTTLRLSIYVFLLASVSYVQADESRPKRSAGTYQVPYRLTDTFHVLVRAKINGYGPYNFIIDTGAPAMFIETAVAKKIGLEPQDGWATLKDLQIEGGVSIAKARARIETPFQLEGINGLGLAGARIHGMIGYNILARYRIEIDFSKDKMSWTELAYVPPPPLVGGKGAAGGLDTLGAIMKFVGAWLGKKAAPDQVPRGFLGIRFADGDETPKVSGVLPQSPAALADIRPGDILLRVGEQEVESIADAYGIIARHARNDSLPIQVRREDKKMNLVVKLGEGL
jgi:membrane-associated protease RseP (regulator of RpoE activity)